MMAFLAHMKVKAGKQEDFVRLVRALTEKVRANEPETTAYEFFKLRDDPLSYAVFEQLTSEEAEETHRNTAHFREFAPDAIEYLDGTYGREFLDPLK